MAQTVLITLTVAGADTGPFNLLSDADGYAVPFETGVPKASLVSGYTSVLVPDLATIIRVQSTSVLCPNYVDLPISGLTTTTTTTAEPTTTTTTTTEEPTTTTTTSTSSTTTTTTTEAPETITIDVCGAQQADGSGQVVVYAYSSGAVDTNVSVNVTWTAADLSTISGTVVISSTTTCGTVTLTGADPSETGSNITIDLITPGSFGNQTYVSGSETLSSSCTSCPIP